MKIELDIDCIAVQEGPHIDRIYIRSSNFPPTMLEDDISLTLLCMTYGGEGVQYVKDHFHVEPVLL